MAHPFLHREILLTTLVKVLEDSVEVPVPLDGSHIVLIDKQILEQEAELVGLLSREGEAELAAVLVSLLLLDGLEQQVQSLVLSVLVHAALDESEVSDVVRRNPIIHHSFVHQDCLFDHVGLDARLDHAGVHKDSWLHPLLLHLVENSQRFFDLSELLVDLCQNGVGDIACLDLQLLHVAVALQSHLQLVGLQASVQKRVVENFVGLDTLFQHLLVEGQSLLDIFAPTMTFNQCRKSDEVRFDSPADSIVAVERIGSTLASHILEYLGSLVNFVAPHAAVDDGVKRDDIGLDAHRAVW